MEAAISIVTPTCNRPRLLLRTLRSVQMQDFADWELLVVDDGDGSGMAAARALGDARIRAFRNPGRGQVDARNHALAHARGRIVHLLDDDDRWEDAAHLRTVAAAVGEDDGLAYRGGWLVQEREHEADLVETGRVPFDPDADADAMRRNNLLLCSGVAYPRSLHAILGAFDATMNHYWDWDWYLRVNALRPMRRLGPPMVAISLRGSNASASPQAPDYVRYLQRLSEKHGLASVEPKNHLSLASA